MIKAQKVRLNNIPAHAGLAAVDALWAPPSCPKDDPLNKIHPGRFLYGAPCHRGSAARLRPVRLWCEGYGTDCYPRRELEKDVTLATSNTRPCSIPQLLIQNYKRGREPHEPLCLSYMGPLKPNAS